jgi:hypothetical protein
MTPIEYKSRIEDLERFYSLTNRLKENLGGYRYLSQCDGGMSWPKRGVYFFFEPGEYRSDQETLRVVRVGTHAVSQGSKSTLWSRLRSHRGHISGEGNHRRSVFRLLIGSALIRQGNYSKTATASWGINNSASREIRDNERGIERDVSSYIGTMPFLWVAIDDLPGIESDRKFIERNSIGLLSLMNGNPDRPSKQWLGHFCIKTDVRESGLWNSDHVREQYNPEFLHVLEKYISAMESVNRSAANVKNAISEQLTLASIEDTSNHPLWLATVTLRSDTFKYPDDDQEKNKAKNKDRFSACLRIITNLAHEFPGPGVVLFPGGYFHSGTDEIATGAVSCLSRTVENVALHLKNIEKTHPATIVAVIGIDGKVDLAKGDSYRYDRNQIAVAITKEGMVAFAKKFHPTDTVEKLSVDCSDNFLSSEKALHKTWDRWFNLENKKFYLAVCNDIKGLPYEKKPEWIDYILNLVHGCYRLQDGPTCSYFVRLGFGRASLCWECPVFGAVVFFRRDIPEKWRSGMSYKTWDKSPIQCETDENSLMPVSSDDSVKLSDGFARVDVYRLDNLQHRSDVVLPSLITAHIPGKNKSKEPSQESTSVLDEQFQQILTGLVNIFGNTTLEQKTKISFRGKNVVGYPGKKDLDIISLFKPSKSSKYGIKFRIYTHLLATILNTDEKSVAELLPKNSQYDKKRDNPHVAEIFYAGYFESEDQIHQFLEGLEGKSKTKDT